MSYSVAFEEFWRKYPKKAGKADAYKAWNTEGIAEDEELQSAIIQDVSDRRDKHHGWRTKQFIPMPATYLRNKRWEDEIDIRRGDSDGIVSRDMPEAEIDPTVTDEQILETLCANKWSIDEVALNLKVPRRRVEYFGNTHYEEILAERIKRFQQDFTSFYYQVKRDIRNYLEDLKHYQEKGNERQLGQSGAEREQVSGQGGSGGLPAGEEPDDSWL